MAKFFKHWKKSVRFQYPSTQTWIVFHVPGRGKNCWIFSPGSTTTPWSLRGFKQQGSNCNHENSTNPIFFVAHTNIYHLCLLPLFKNLNGWKKDESPTCGPTTWSVCSWSTPIGPSVLFPSQDRIWIHQEQCLNIKRLLNTSIDLWQKYWRFILNLIDGKFNKLHNMRGEAFWTKNFNHKKIHLYFSLNQQFLRFCGHEIWYCLYFKCILFNINLPCICKLFRLGYYLAIQYKICTVIWTKVWQILNFQFGSIV